VPASSFPGLNLRDGPGPVAVQIAYRIDPQARLEFLRRINDVGTHRRRDGAIFWRINRDLNHPDCYLEPFIVDSWSSYLRHQSRVTLAGQQAEASVRALHCRDGPPEVSHFIGESLLR
jgi:hypothetical protein